MRPDAANSQRANSIVWQVRMDFAEHLEQVLGRGVDVLTPVGLRSIRVKRIAEEIEENMVYV